MEEAQNAMGERLVQGMKHLKTQRLLPVVNHTFLIADSTVLYSDQKKNYIYLSGWLCKTLGIKDKGGQAGLPRKAGLQTWLPYFALLAAVVLAGGYPVALSKMEGSLFQRIFGRYLVNLVLLAPVALVEVRRKVAKEMFSLRDALDGRTLLTNYRNSVCLTLWSLFMGLSLQHTELSTTLYFSNLMLFFWVVKKIFKRASGISESEVNGSILLLLGTIVFGIKQWLSATTDLSVTSLYQNHSFLGVTFATAASLSAATFFITNYELTYYLPSYSACFLVTLFSLLNLEAVWLALSLVYPAYTGAAGLLSLSTVRLVFSSAPTLLKYLFFGSYTVFGTFALQHLLINTFDSLIVGLAFQLEPFVGLALGIWFGIQALELSSLLLYLLALVCANLLIVIGIRQFEDKYEGGILGMSNEQRNEVRIDHLRELQLWGVGDISETGSRGGA